MPMPVAQFMITDDHLQSQIRKLLAYCQANDWAGYDPYDAVNSKVFSVLPFLNSRLPRLVLTQALKRSPMNIRRLLFVPRTHNPKLSRCSSRHSLISRESQRLSRET